MTGGAGFIGANFVLDWLSGSTEPVVTLDALSYAGNLSNLEPVADNPLHLFVCGDIGNSALVRRLLGENRVRAIVNFAAESHVDRSIASPRGFFETNVLGTQGLLDATRGYVDSLPAERRTGFRFLHVSTDEVYGALGPDDPAFRETDPMRPNSPYAASKAASDMVVRAYGQTFELDVVTTNCSNNYGPLQFPEKLIPLVILNALAGRPLPVYGDGQQVRDWLHVSDHCAALRRVLEGGRTGETYNIGGSHQATNLEVVHAICALLDVRRPRADGRSYAELITHVVDRRGHDRRYAIDIGKIETELGWTPKVNFGTGLAETVDWYLTHTDWTSNVTSGAYRTWMERQYG